MQAGDGKFAWTAKIGEKGQLVIPKQARDLFGLQPGTTVILLGDLERGLALVRGDSLAEYARFILDAISERPEDGSETDDTKKEQ